MTPGWAEKELKFVYYDDKISESHNIALNSRNCQMCNIRCNKNI